jgi:phosphate uptake regulator
MEYRKLISFGKSSYVVSLPKNWVTQNKIKKGDLIYFNEDGQNLILSKNQVDETNSEKTKVIYVDGKNLPQIAREVNSAYILNYRNIVLKGKEIKDKIKDLQNTFQNLIALEVMEQTTDSIIAKDFLNMDQVSMDELIRKMDIITRTMLQETSHSILKDNYENINDRDKDVNRLYFLLYRSVLYNLEHLTNAMKKYKLGPLELFSKHFTGFYIEGVADEARRTARFIRLVKISPKDRNLLVDLFNRVTNYYIQTMKSIYDQDVDASLKLSGLKNAFNKELDELDERCKEINFVATSSRIRRMISNVHSLGRLVYTGVNY